MLIKSKLCILSISLLMNTSIALANTCSQKTKNVDLRKEMVPIRDQDSVGWCYAFTAADLISHYLYKKSQTGWHPFGVNDFRTKDNSVSAVGVSGAYNYENKLNFFTNMPITNTAEQMASKFSKRVIPEGGQIWNAIEAAKTKGICFEKDLRSENFSFVRDIRCSHNDHCNVDDVLKIIYNQAGPHPQCGNYSAVKAMFPNLSIDQIRAILHYSEKSNALNRLMSITCQKPIETNFFGGRTDKPEVKSYLLSGLVHDKNGTAVATRSMIMDKVDEALDRGTPAGIQYFARVLVHDDGQKTSPHASSIVGKFTDPSTCEVNYILKNSWGSDCAIMTTETEAFRSCVKVIDQKKLSAVEIFNQTKLCKNKFPRVGRNPKVRCDERTGYLYIPKSVMQENVYTTTSLVE
jgi:hypothetical protein